MAPKRQKKNHILQVHYVPAIFNLTCINLVSLTLILDNVPLHCFKYTKAEISAEIYTGRTLKFVTSNK